MAHLLLFSHFAERKGGDGAGEPVAEDGGFGEMGQRPDTQGVPETARWILARCYVPTWVLCAYGALYVIVLQEVVRFDTNERLGTNNYYCLDPLAGPRWQRSCCGLSFRLSRSELDSPRLRI
jgi:hypothetical protein